MGLKKCARTRILAHQPYLCSQEHLNEAKLTKHTREINFWLGGQWPSDISYVPKIQLNPNLSVPNFCDPFTGLSWQHSMAGVLASFFPVQTPGMVSTPYLCYEAKQSLFHHVVLTDDPPHCSRALLSSKNPGTGLMHWLQKQRLNWPRTQALCKRLGLNWPRTQVVRVELASYPSLMYEVRVN